jgi:hypothetical protein
VADRADLDVLALQAYGSLPERRLLEECRTDAGFGSHQLFDQLGPRLQLRAAEWRELDDGRGSGYAPQVLSDSASAWQVRFVRQTSPYRLLSCLLDRSFI